MWCNHKGEDFHTTILNGKDAITYQTHRIRSLCASDQQKSESVCDTVRPHSEISLCDEERGFVYALPTFCLCHYFYFRDLEKIIASAVRAIRSVIVSKSGFKSRFLRGWSLFTNHWFRVALDVNSCHRRH